MKLNDELCTVGIIVPDGSRIKAFDVRISGQDIYVNYADRTTPSAHSSYHASGQHHIKIGSRYIEWSGGLSGAMEPMKLFRTPPADVNRREDFFPIGWDVPRLQSILPPLTSEADFLVDATKLDHMSILAFYVSLVTEQIGSRGTISGFRVIKSHRFGSGIRVEIDAFVVAEQTNL